MKRMIAAVTAMTAGILVWSSLSFAAGFRLPESDSAAMGMANAFVGQADNPSAVWYNPAAITQLDGTQVSGGTVAIYPVLTHENNNGTTDVSQRDVHFPIHLFATHKLNDNFAVGFGITNPFGLSSDWDPANSSTKYVSTFTKLVTTEFNPNVAYKFGKSFSLAAGIDFVHLRATMEKTLTPPVPGTPNFRLNGDGDGWGANIAAKYDVSETLHAGLSYRSRVKIDIDGSADIASGPLARSNSAKTDITLPDLIQAGISYRLSDAVSINADIDYTLWSTYDRLVIVSDTLIPLTGSRTTTDEKQWRDTWCLRIGGQYKLSDQWKVRAGYLYDQTPVKEERFETRTPDSDRQGVSIGAGYTGGKITVDAAYLYLRFNNRTINNSLADNATATPNALNGTYKSQVHLAGVTVGYKF